MKKEQIAGMIDHTLLKAFATKEQIAKLCDEAAEYHFASVCVNPAYVPQAAKRLKGTGVEVCTVIGFPLGANTSAVKAFETKDAIANGAQEIDMVINIGAMKSGLYDVVEQDIKAVVDAAAGTLVKVIIEACYLTDEEKQIACRAAAKAGADFVKTSTGFGTHGATPADVALMKKSIPAGMKVKAAGGIHSYEECMAMIDAGADRVGASAGIAIVNAAE
ncbi:MAG TPA: deoxyribose-phosphate aldolase [Candidatus Limiplasma sp.]|nr:deoxyribose-phosphate aldolase [Candidatus Limiplasma sp.]